MARSDSVPLPTRSYARRKRSAAGRYCALATWSQPRNSTEKLNKDQRFSTKGQIVPKRVPRLLLPVLHSTHRTCYTSMWFYLHKVGVSARRLVGGIRQHRPLRAVHVVHLRILIFRVAGYPKDAGCARIRELTRRLGMVREGPSQPLSRIIRVNRGLPDEERRRSCRQHYRCNIQVIGGRWLEVGGDRLNRTRRRAGQTLLRRGADNRAQGPLLTSKTQ